MALAIAVTGCTSLQNRNPQCVIVCSSIEVRTGLPDEPSILTPDPPGKRRPQRYIVVQ